jgi:hypothetical protein
MGSVRAVFFLTALAVACLGGFPQSVCAAPSEDGKAFLDEIRSLKPEVGRGIGLEVRIAKGDAEGTEAAGRKRFLVKVAKPAYLTALYVSSEGKPFVLFPDGESSSIQLAPDKEYVFSAPDADTAGDPKSRKGKAVFLVTTRPWDTKTLIEDRDAGQRPLGAIRARARLLAARLKETAAADDGYNQAVLDLDARKPSLKLMGLPSASKSKKPEEVMGTQGRDDEEAKREAR